MEFSDKVYYLRKKITESLSGPKYSEIIAEYREDTQSPDFDKRAGNLADNIRRLIKTYDEGMEILKTYCHPADAAAFFLQTFYRMGFQTGQ